MRRPRASIARTKKDRLAFMAKKKSRHLSGRLIDPQPITPDTRLADLVDETFVAYNAARLREACQLFTQKMLEPDTTIGLSITGALTPAGLGISALIPLVQAGLLIGSFRQARTSTTTRTSELDSNCVKATPQRRTSRCAKKRWCASTTSSSIIRCC